MALFLGTGLDGGRGSVVVVVVAAASDMAISPNETTISSNSLLR